MQTQAPETQVTLMEALKNGTERCHRELETVPLLSRLFAADLDTPAYQELIIKFYGFYAPLEAAIASAFASQPGEVAAVSQSFTPKTPALRHDLEALGMTADQIEVLPRCTDLPPTDTPAHAAGVVYVLEGATLGGQIIVRKLREQLGENGAGALQFYTGYGENTGPHWKGFMMALGAYGASVSEAQHSQTVEAAVATFKSLQQWLEEK